MIGQNFLHTPGPTYVPEEILNAMHRQPLDFGDERVADLLEQMKPGLRLLFQTNGHVFVYIANGHGGWEAVVSNICDVGDTVLIPTTGFFSTRWVEVSMALGLRVIEIPSPDGHNVDFNMIRAMLRADVNNEIKAIFATQTDTGAGVTHSIAEFRRCLDDADHAGLLVADCIASLGASEFMMDRWGVDVAITASQKALMLPPGLALVAANAKALAVAAKVRRPKLYWDWGARQSDVVYHRFCGTLPIHLLFGLQAALDLIFSEGLDQRVARHRLIADAVHAAVGAWVKGGDLAFLVPEPRCRSVSVTAIAVTSDRMSAEAIRTTARNQFGVSVAGGLGRLANRIIRIGHLGAVNAPMILGCLGGLEATFECLGIRYEPGTSAAARVLGKAGATGARPESTGPVSARRPAAGQEATHLG